MDNKWFKLISEGTTELSLPLNSLRIDQLVRYVELLAKWSKVYNLTAIRNKENMIHSHILDSLSIIKYIKGRRLLDIGSGAGIPGIPLAIACPDIKVSTLDSNGKKVRFMEHVRLSLGIQNLQVIHRRVEAYETKKKFDIVVSRAFSSLRDMFMHSRHLLEGRGFFLAMKGRYPTEELKELNGTDIKINCIIPYEAGIERKSHHIVIMSVD